MNWRVLSFFMQNSVTHNGDDTNSTGKQTLNFEKCVLLTWLAGKDILPIDWATR